MAHMHTSLLLFHFQCCNYPGDLPYHNIPMPSLVARVVSGYRLPKPKHASEEV